MDTKRTDRAGRSASRRAAFALAATVAVLGCDPQVQPGGSSGTSTSGTGDIFDTAGGNGGNNGTPDRDCGGGPYLFSVSASDVDPFQQTGEVSESGVTTLYFWKASGGGLGAVAGDFDVVAPGDSLTFVQFAAVAPHLNVEREGLQQVFLAAAGCPYGPVLLGKLTVYGLPETLRVRLVARTEGSVAVDCCANKPGVPLACNWFEAVLPDTAGSDSTSSATQAGA
jgi:hypothetical protein